MSLIFGYPEDKAKLRFRVRAGPTVPLLRTLALSSELPSGPGDEVVSEVAEADEVVSRDPTPRRAVT